MHWLEEEKELFGSGIPPSSGPVINEELHGSMADSRWAAICLDRQSIQSAAQLTDVNEACKKGQERPQNLEHSKRQSGKECAAETYKHIHRFSLKAALRVNRQVDVCR